MVGKVKEFLEEQIKTIAEAKDWKIIELEVMLDHIHLSISTPPFEALLEKFPELREEEFWEETYSLQVIISEQQDMFLPRPLKSTLKELRIVPAIHPPVFNEWFSCGNSYKGDFWWKCSPNIFIRHPPSRFYEGGDKEDTF